MPLSRASLLMALAGSLASCTPPSAGPRVEGRVVAGLGLPIAEVQKRSTLPHRWDNSPGHYLVTRSFDFEMADGTLRVPGCHTSMIEVEGPEQRVKSIAFYIGAGRPDWPADWPAHVRRLKAASTELAANGWQPDRSPGRPALETTLDQDAAKALVFFADGVEFVWRKGDQAASLFLRTGPTGQDTSAVMSLLTFSAAK